MSCAIHKFILETENVIQSIELHKPPLVAENEWTMYADIQTLQFKNFENFELKKVMSENEWHEMISLRTDVEKSFGIKNQELISNFIDDIKRKSKMLNGCWYLAYYKKHLIGEIGIIPFQFQDKKIGRLQDVDIHPAFQNKGYGNMLLNSICKVVEKENYDGLCLMAKSDDWPKDWYRKFGFEKVGQTRLEERQNAAV